MTLSDLGSVASLVSLITLPFLLFALFPSLQDRFLLRWNYSRINVSQGFSQTSEGWFSELRIELPVYADGVELVNYNGIDDKYMWSCPKAKSFRTSRSIAASWSSRGDRFGSWIVRVPHHRVDEYDLIYFLPSFSSINTQIKIDTRNTTLHIKLFDFLKNNRKVLFWHKEFLGSRFYPRRNRSSTA